MGFLAPIPERSEFGFGPPAQEPADDVYGKTMNFLKSILNAPGAGALMGGPWGALGAVRTLFHGTTEPAAQAIMRKGFDLQRFGMGADVGHAQPGFYGRGVYLSENPDVAEQYAKIVSGEGGPPGAVLKTTVDDAHLFDATPAKYDGRRFAEKVNYRAVKQGKKGSMFTDGDGVNETVIFDPSILQSVERYK